MEVIKTTPKKAAVVAETSIDKILKVVF